MIVLLLVIATTFLIVFMSQSLPLQMKVVCYVFLAIAVLLLVVPFAPLRGSLW